MTTDALDAIADNIIIIIITIDRKELCVVHFYTYYK